jgi:zinc protease
MSSTLKHSLTRIAFLLVLSLLLAACRPVQAPPASADSSAPAAAALATGDGASDLPFDPDVRVGKLDNGLTYYIRSNTEPPDRADLWLAINAGSVLEEDDQKGLAHFLEHMLFNGTENFPGQELVNYLESIGMRFGPDVNAYTSFDETVYTLQVPTDDSAKLQKAFDVLADWSSRATISPEEVDAERGVIVEEWRMRDLNAGGRVNDAEVETLLGGSQYAARLPIGDMEIVRSAPAETLRRFYETWYRPDNMAVIAVGDFADLDQVEGWIRDRFGSLPNPQAKLDRPTFDVPDYGSVNARVITDPEFPATYAYVVYRQPAEHVRTKEEYRTGLADGLATSILNQRYAEMIRKADAPFLSASTGTGEFVRPVQIASLGVQTEEDKALPGLEAALAEVERARQHGFTEAELARAKADFLRQYKSSYDERNNIESDAFAQDYLNNFLTGAVPIGVTDSYSLAQELLPVITLAEVNDRIQTLYAPDNRAVVLVAPKKEGVTLPDEAALTSLLENVAQQKYDPYAETKVSGELVANPPAPAAITSEETITDLGITHITLGNGVQVYLKPTDFKDDEVVLSSDSPGGESIVPDAEVPTAALATYLVTQSGVGSYSQTDLEKLLTGKLVNLSPYIGELGEGFSGSASPQDLETLFQLVYLYATEPRMDPAAYTLLQRQVQEYLKNRALDPSSKLDDKYNEIFCGDNPRCSMMAVYNRLNEVDPDQALELYKQRFADLDDSVFVLTGAFDVDKAKQLAQTYLGNLPAAASSETWRDTRPPLPEGVIDETVNAGIDPRSEVQIYFDGPFTPTLESRVALQAMTGVLDIMVREDLREKRGGIYGAGISSYAELHPEGSYETQITFTAEPTRVVELTDAVFAEIKDLSENGPSAANFAKVKEQLRREHEENLQSNDAWVSWINRYVVDAEGPLTEVERINDVIDALTPEEIQAMAAAVLPPDRHVTLVLHPQDFKQ